MNITAFELTENGIKAAAFIAPERLLSLLQSDVTSGSNADIILKTFIGMVFIMIMMWLAAIVAGKLGTRMTKLREAMEKTETAENVGKNETETENNIENKTGGDNNG